MDNSYNLCEKHDKEKGNSQVSLKWLPWVKGTLPLAFIYLTPVTCLVLGTLLDTKESTMNKNHEWYTRPTNNHTVCWVLLLTLP